MQKDFFKSVAAGLFVNALVLIVTHFSNNEIFKISLLVVGTIFALIIAYLVNNDSLPTLIFFLILGSSAYFVWSTNLLDYFKQSAIPSSTATSNAETLSPNFEQIDISFLSELDAPGDNLGLLPGRNILAGVPFDNGWVATTECSHLPDQPPTLIFNTSISHPKAVYFILQTGYGDLKYNQQTIGYIKLGFSNGSSVSEDLILGYNIRDWNWGNPYAVTTTTSANVQPAWQGSNSDGTSGGMDMLTFPIPKENQQSSLTQIEIGDLSRLNSGGINPCIHLLGITAENLK